MFDLTRALEQVVERGGSDLHFKAGNRPLIRVNGELEWLDEGLDALEPWETVKILHDLVPEAAVKDFESRHELDRSYSVPGLPSFRINAYVQRGTIAVVLRVIPRVIKSVSELGLPEVVSRLAEEERGLIMVTGSSGCGKSTTLAAMISHINKTMRKHVVTIEDPIEYLHEDELSSIDQREVGSDTDSFPIALHQVLRQDPDVILIGEMRDFDSVRTALSAAETGHLVLSTLHTVDAAETLNRIIDFFPSREIQQARAMLGSTLKGVISQRLVPTADGHDRVAIAEVLTMTGRVHELIVNPPPNGELSAVIASGDYYGMQSFDQALFKAIKRGDVALEDAMRHATAPHDLRLLIQSDGQLQTTMAQVDAAQARRA